MSEFDCTVIWVDAGLCGGVRIFGVAELIGVLGLILSVVLCTV